jgi:hypothetical protein
MLLPIVEIAGYFRHFVVVEYGIGRPKLAREIDETLLNQVLVQRHIAICFAFLAAGFRRNCGYTNVRPSSGCPCPATA